MTLSSCRTSRCSSARATTPLSSRRGGEQAAGAEVLHCASGALHLRAATYGLRCSEHRVLPLLRSSQLQCSVLAVPRLPADGAQRRLPAAVQRAQQCTGKLPAAASACCCQRCWYSSCCSMLAPAAHLCPQPRPTSLCRASAMRCTPPSLRPSASWPAPKISTTGTFWSLRQMSRRARRCCWRPRPRSWPTCGSCMPGVAVEGAAMAGQQVHGEGEGEIRAGSQRCATHVCI